MWQAQITSPTGQPVTDRALAAELARRLGGANAEAVDAEQGVWLIDLNRYNNDRVERDGYLGISLGSGYVIEIETP